MFIKGSGFELRPVHEDDLKAVLAVYRLCEDFLALTPTPIATMNMVLQDIAHSQMIGGDYCAICDLDGNMVGIVDVITRDFEGKPDTAFIELLMIGKPHRNGGLGSAVVEAVEAEMCRDTGVGIIETAVMVNNPAAIRFWERQGYAKVGEAQLQADGTTSWRMRKGLPSPTCFR